MTTINECDLVYSEDDDARTGKGFYFQKNDLEGLTSDDSYESRDEAINAMKKNLVTFGENCETKIL